MYKNNIKDKIKYTNNLCRITLLWIFCCFSFGWNFRTLRLMAYAFLYSTTREIMKLCWIRNKIEIIELQTIFSFWTKHICMINPLQQFLWKQRWIWNNTCVFTLKRHWKNHHYHIPMIYIYIFWFLSLYFASRLLNGTWMILIKVEALPQCLGFAASYVSPVFVIHYLWFSGRNCLAITLV